MSQEPWELLRDHDFPEEEWKSILKPLGNVTVTKKDREAIVITEIIYLSRRIKELAAGEFGWLTRPAQIAQCLDQVSTAAAKLRIAMRNASAKLDIEILPPIWAQDKSTVPFGEFSWHGKNWNNLMDQVSALEEMARDRSQYWTGVSTAPANVDTARDEAWMRLAEIFVTLTGKKPTASPRTSKREAYANGYAAFVEAFMAAIPRQRRLTDDEIPNFLRTERYRERMRKFLDAHHGLLREPRLKKPPKRS